MPDPRDAVPSAPTILLLSTSDTDLITARASGAGYRWANPSRLVDGELEELLAGADIAVVRILGGYRAWQDGIDAVVASGVPAVVVSGEQTPDAELMRHSTAPQGAALQTHIYLAQGGLENLRNLHAFLSDTLLMTGFGFAPPVATPSWGILERPLEHAEAQSLDGAPKIAVLYYRAQQLAGNTAYVEALCRAIENAGGRPLPVFCASLRTAEPELLELLGTADALITTVLAAGGATPAAVGAGGDDDSWNVAHLAALDIPILQGLCLTSSRSDWSDNDDGLSPLDVATQVAVPEFDGRIITVPFSFKEIDHEGLISYVADPERCARVAGLAVRHARLKSIAAKDKRVALVFSAYPTKHARIGNAVGLDTPASAVALLRAMRAHGYDLGADDAIPGVISGDGDALIHALIERGGQDAEWLTEEQLARNPIRVPAKDYREWFATLPAELADAVVEHWGPPPGHLFVDRSRDPDGEIVIAALQAGNLVIMVQPPRGFGENPVAIYHDPDLPPSHHYLAAYRWLDSAFPESFGADAVIHLGKHGNLEWLPGKTLGMSAACGTDAALGDLPLIYPFLVNDPGEGTQAKRRAHATLVDHLIPPMARAETYGDIAKLEQLLDEHANVSALDPGKLPAIRQQIWTLMRAAKMDHDLGLQDRPDEDSFDDMLLHVDGWLCEIKDVQIRDGLHVLGQKPTGAGELDLVLAILRARQLFGGEQTVPGLRQALGLVEDGSDDRAAVDAAEAGARELVAALQETGWDPAAVDTITDNPDIARILKFAATEVVPRLAGTECEIDQVLRALDGGFIPSGPSGSPLRGLVNVLPTGRNFYSVDPKAVPSRLAWETGVAMADSLLARYREDYGRWPQSVGLSVWGTSAMRTAGDDIAEVLALLGVRPVWDDASRRVVNLEPIDLAELGRPRIDVTVRISGFFRDAFPHVVTMLDDAVALVAALDEPAEHNYVRAHAQADLAEHGDERRATTRIFGSKPGTYGAGLLQLIDSRNWRDDADLAQVYTAWGGFAYGRGLDGAAASDDMNRAYRRIAVAAKNTDTREHDIADSDDYFQYHGGMVATVRALTGKAPAAYIGDNTRPDAVRTRTLSEETNRVFRARVVNPRWINAMRRHGYKGAFEMAATVDYLFGYDATAHVMADWMYERLAGEYVLDDENRKFMNESNPWALHGMAERLLEAATRGMWAEPEPATLDGLRQVLLETEGELEG
ncbi:cobaltochelatase subunit CobN [Mycolicibacterium smegmatis]|uniref:Cobaltochelatase, CobN subunit n=4 Tax=Mycobacteriaceae TaxID=1762 RepID=A0QZ17_MYCS2|nr:cobaltochelatase subunit CobN [Mycolicibacterium smegmatis]ABK72329.1 cobaltochelatase, CobN subunit [Mycolicibacterium smegmatis MC2 155]AFP40232.1 Cobaltochelatase, CobN subunit [Mycolicibacterium smegmatis MC2 155]AIU08981.1 cobalamin biosynthesis protein CobN [Mycolicibacterium smegmatis MC2 155]AIU15606.1 cobalamin biosynthesis protein CobN [Mycolicibacterium smegmatis]AIU22229.1 cobalamin biosynthesis protein CobN [Mycolicibacterium smegmatis]